MQTDWTEKRRSKTDKKDMATWGVAAAIALAFMLCILIPSGKTKEYDIVFFGDSVIGNKTVYELPFINEAVSGKIGKKVFNGAFGGSAMADSGRETDALCIDAWSMVNLAKAVCEGDWDAIRAMMSYADKYKDSNRQAFDGYKERMEQLAKIDFDEVEVILIEHGSNDFSSNVPLDNPDNLYDERTFAGALRTTIELFQEQYPELKIVIMTPVYCEIPEKNGGTLLLEYVEKEKEIAEEYGVYVLDAFYLSGIDEENVHLYTLDGLHPNGEGMELLGNLIADYLKGNIYEN